jgi:hypothetical protein
MKIVESMHIHHLQIIRGINRVAPSFVMIDLDLRDFGRP